MAETVVSATEHALENQRLGGSQQGARIFSLLPEWQMINRHSPRR
jgi:hypothetical protein